MNTLAEKSKKISPPIENPQEGLRMLKKVLIFRKKVSISFFSFLERIQYKYSLPTIITLAVTKPLKFFKNANLLDADAASRFYKDAVFDTTEKAFFGT